MYARRKNLGSHLKILPTMALNSQSLHEMADTVASILKHREIFKLTILLFLLNIL